MFGSPGNLSPAWAGQGLLPTGFRPRRKTGYPRSRMDEPSLATERTPAGARRAAPASEVVATIPPEIGRPPRKRPRQTRVVLRKVGPWSVFKFSLLFYLCVMTVILLGLFMVVIWSLINVFIALLYNLIAEVIGGIEVTLAERH